MRSNEVGEPWDTVVAEVAALVARLAELSAVPGSDADRIDRIAAFERARGAVAAAQQAEMVAFARSQVEAHIADGTLDPRTVGPGIGDQIGLACRVSPFPRLPAARHRPCPAVRPARCACAVGGRTGQRGHRRDRRLRNPSSRR
jgi:hypothetical protein